MKLLLLGSGGQLGQRLHQVLDAQESFEVHAWDRSRADLAQLGALQAAIVELGPQCVINAAAYTAVDKAETEPELAHRINGEAPGVIATACAELGIPLIHYSTDYVFNGVTAQPWRETDATAPLNVYGASKLAGEQAIRAVLPQHLILRTSWVYGLQGRNFLLTMQRLLQERDAVNVVADQIGAPSWVGSLALGTLDLLKRWQAGTQAWGTYHFCNAGSTSWFGFAEAIAADLRESGRLRAQVSPIPAADYPTPAQRPADSRLDCNALREQWGVVLPDWQKALRACLDEASRI